MCSHERPKQQQGALHRSPFTTRGIFGQGESTHRPITASPSHPSFSRPHLCQIPHCKYILLPGPHLTKTCKLPICLSKLLLASPGHASSTASLQTAFHISHSTISAATRAAPSPLDAPFRFPSPPPSGVQFDLFRRAPSAASSSRETRTYIHDRAIGGERTITLTLPHCYRPDRLPGYTATPKAQSAVRVSFPFLVQRAPPKSSPWIPQSPRPALRAPSAIGLRPRIIEGARRPAPNLA